MAAYLLLQSLHFIRDFLSFSLFNCMDFCKVFPGLLLENVFVKANDYCDCYFQRLMEMFFIYFSHFPAGAKAFLSFLFVSIFV